MAVVEEKNLGRVGKVLQMCIYTANKMCIGTLPCIVTVATAQTFSSQKLWWTSAQNIMGRKTFGGYLQSTAVV